MAGFESQSALGRAAGVPQPTINRILKNPDMQPEAGTLRKLAAACNVSFDWLNEGIGKIERLAKIKPAESQAIDNQPIEKLTPLEIAELLSLYGKLPTNGRETAMHSLRTAAAIYSRTDDKFKAK